MKKNKIFFNFLILNIIFAFSSVKAQTVNPFSGAIVESREDAVFVPPDILKEELKEPTKNVAYPKIIKKNKDSTPEGIQWVAKIPVRVLSKVKTQGSDSFFIIQSSLGTATVRENEKFELGVLSTKKDRIFLNETEIFFEFSTFVHIALKEK